MKFLRSGWFVCVWLTECAGNFVLWAFWLGLAALLALQLVIALSHELRVPNRVVRSFEHRLAHAGLRITFESASFDPGGHVLVEQLQVFSESFEEPLVSAKSVFLQIDPWSLLSGSLDARWVRAHGVTFSVPAMLSPSGRTDPVIENITLRIERQSSDIAIAQFTGNAGPLALSIHGALRPVRSTAGTPRSARNRVSTLLTQYLHLAKQLALGQAKLTTFEEPALDVLLEPDAHSLARIKARFSARSGELSQNNVPITGFVQKARISGLRLEAVLPLVVGEGAPVELRAGAQGIQLGDGTGVQDLATLLSGRLQTSPFKFEPGRLLAAASEAQTRGYSVQAISLSVDPRSWPRIHADLTGSFADETWRVHADGDPNQRAGQIRAEGSVSQALLKHVGDKTKRSLLTYLTPETPVRLHAQALLEPGGKLAEASGRFETGKLVAYRVPVDRTSGRFRFAGTQLEVSDITLSQGQNSAAGSYTMDTKSLAYRFLVTGRVRPVGISGWFHDWWPRFWSNFDFSNAPPDADVDVQGRWREPHLSTVFVHAECDGPAIRGVPLNRVRTTLFIRPDFYDALEVYATHGEGSARGRFTRAVDMGKPGFRWMEFDVTSTVDVQAGARLFGKEGIELVEPFRFEKPPLLKVSGRLDGQASARGVHEEVSIQVNSTGGFWFFDFPLSNLVCSAHVRDHDIDLSDVRVTFAMGTAQGRALVSGVGDDRRLSFDATLRDAGLGDSIRILENYSARRRGEEPPPVSRFQQRVASGKLSLKAAATGLYRDSTSYVGQGTAELRGAELAEVNLLGALSEALRGNSLLGFTSWRLNSAQARFAIDRSQLVFPELTIKGPTAKLDARGAYALDSKTMKFNATFHPFEQGKTLLANAVDLVLTPVSAVLELRLTGSLDQPKWFFSYGPTSFLRKLSGADLEKKTPAEAPRPAPSPLLRP